MPGNYPSWVSWNSREVYLPSKFHSWASFKSTLSILKDSLCKPLVLEGGKVDAPLLLSGLMYQEVCCAMEMEPDAFTGAPKSLINSPFSIKELKEIEAVLDNVVVDATDA